MVNRLLFAHANSQLCSKIFLVGRFLEIEVKKEGRKQSSKYMAI